MINKMNSANVTGWISRSTIERVYNSSMVSSIQVWLKVSVQIRSAASVRNGETVVQDDLYTFIYYNKF